jgi:OOP family OmpA-OmpF porin
LYKTVIQPLVGQLLLLVCWGSISHALAADDFQQIDTLQRRTEKIAFDKLDPNYYHLAKARTWLDLALSEYYDKDDSGIVAASVSQAAALLDALEKNQTGISMDMPAQVPGSEMVRPDLWNRIAALKKNAKFSCGQRPAAEAEVFLVWAGHEKSESGLSHAESYLRGAEDRIYSAEVAIKNCADNATPLVEKVTLSTDVLFSFDQAKLEPSALWHLDKLADSIRQMNPLKQVVLVGHTDRLRSDGQEDRNILLSIHRAESIKQYLITKGIPADKIRATGAGSTQPIVKCSITLSKEEQVICLQPNRRVEITLRGERTTSDKILVGNKDLAK